ncbi:isoprenylcysteine carboxylmethyltransferase family protein [bacterium]|nr:isoprenylcysteine carboxylmethyltransferase family protein [bacterium]
MKIEKIGYWLFKMRSYTPILFLIVCLWWGQFDPLMYYTGTALILSGELLRIWSVSHIGPGSRVIEKAIGPKLVISGPYRLVRNPIYLSNLLIYLGFAVLSNVFFPVFSVITLSVFLIIYYCIIRYEENFLQETFGAPFIAYKKSVRRFIPDFFSYLKPDYNEPDLRLSLKSEKTTLAAIFISWIAITMRMILKL